MRVCSVYVPNGRSVGSEHYEYKFSWLARLRQHLAAVASPDGAVAVCGDFNIAPEDKDVWDPAAFVGATHVTPEERRAWPTWSPGGSLTPSANGGQKKTSTLTGITAPAISTSTVA